MANIKKSYPHAKVVSWSFDEHRIGLKPVIRRAWFPNDSPPLARVQQQFEWLYVFGFVEPVTGNTYWLLFPTVNVEAFNISLKLFAKSLGAGKNKRIVLVMDKAGWHRGNEIEIPEGIHIEYLPSYSPELQPAEKLWCLVDEPLANKHFDDIATLEEVIDERCRTLRTMKTHIRSHTLYELRMIKGQN